MIELGFLAVACLLAVYPTGPIIGAITQRWQKELGPSEGLPNGGMWIGCLERILVVGFVFLGQYEAIGLLIAAKSILRFGAVSGKDGGRKMSEYVIIGTMLSLIAGLVIGVAAVRLAATVSAWVR